MNARLYDPVLGRFISADTVVPEPGNMQAFNRYSYALNNPLMYTDPSGHVFTIGMAMLIGALVGGVSAGIQTNWDIGAMVSGAIIGAAAGAVGFGAGGWAANSGLGTAIGSNLAGGLVGGAAAGATAGFLGTMANGGGKFFKNTLNGAFFGAVAGAVTGGMLDLQIVEINDVVASMAGAFTSGTMRGGIDDGLIAMAYAAGAAAVSYVVTGVIGEAKSVDSGEDSIGKVCKVALTEDQFDAEYWRYDGTEDRPIPGAKWEESPYMPTPQSLDTKGQDFSYIRVDRIAVGKHNRLVKTKGSYPSVKDVVPRQEMFEYLGGFSGYQYRFNMFKDGAVIRSWKTGTSTGM